MSILSLKKFPTRILRAKYHLFSEACAIEDYINKKSDQKTLEHLKPQIVKEIKHEFINNNNNDDNNKGSQTDASDVIMELHAHIQTL